MDSNPGPSERFSKRFSDRNFNFALNDPRFSDRDLNLKVLPVKPVSDTGGEVQRRTVDTTGDESCNIRKIHVSSLVLALRSPYFHELFMGTENKQVPLEIHASEEAAFMNMMNFMYDADLEATTVSDLVALLLAADKFQVASCVKHCVQELHTLQITCDSALIYLKLPSTELVGPLKDKAKQFLGTLDLSKFHEEALNLPLLGIEVVFSSDNLRIASEDVVFDFLLKWAHKHYPEFEERQQVVASNLIHLIRFPFMSCQKIAGSLLNTDTEKCVMRTVIKALLFKADRGYKQKYLAADASTTKRSFIARDYDQQPIKLIEIEFPYHHCVVYLTLKRDKCLQLHPSGKVYSEPINYGGRVFYLVAACCVTRQTLVHLFGLSLGMVKSSNESLSCAVEYEFSVGLNLGEDYVKKCWKECTLEAGKISDICNLYGVSWEALMAENSHFFTNDCLHIRAKITLKE